MRAIPVLICALALSAAPAAAATLPGFHSPSGNIRCLLLAEKPPKLLCAIDHAVYAQQLQDQCIARSEIDWHGFMVFPDRKSSTVCAGGILYARRPLYANLPYGSTWRRGAFVCESRITGVTCRAGRRHGLFVSRQSWRAW